MYTGLEIHNFRCFRRLHIDGLASVNLIAGHSNSGKTCLLEALYLTVAPNKPDMAIRLAAFRGIERIPAAPEEAFGWLFFRREVNEAIRLITKDDSGATDELELRLAAPSQVPIDSIPSAGEGVSGTAEYPLSQLELLYHLQDKTYSSAAILLPDGQLAIKVAHLPIRRTGVIVPTAKRFPEETAAKFSQLQERLLEGQVLKMMKLFEPRLRKLAVLTTSGQAGVYADIGMSRLIPLALLGEGTARFLQMTLAILTTEGGLVLVDEIENGIHYTALQKVWNAIRDACRDTKVQLFATTHSRECIDAAHKAFLKTREYDFRLVRLDRTDSDTIRPVVYDRETLQAALATDLEVR